MKKRTLKSNNTITVDAIRVKFLAIFLVFFFSLTKLFRRPSFSSRDNARRICYIHTHTYTHIYNATVNTSLVKRKIFFADFIDFPVRAVAEIVYYELYMYARLIDMTSCNVQLPGEEIDNPAIKFRFARKLAKTHMGRNRTASPC